MQSTAQDKKNSIDIPGSKNGAERSNSEKLESLLHQAIKFLFGNVQSVSTNPIIRPRPHCREMHLPAGADVGKRVCGSSKHGGSQGEGVLPVVINF